MKKCRIVSSITPSESSDNFTSGRSVPKILALWSATLRASSRRRGPACREPCVLGRAQPAHDHRRAHAARTPPLRRVDAAAHNARGGLDRPGGHRPGRGDHESQAPSRAGLSSINRTYQDRARRLTFKWLAEMHPAQFASLYGRLVPFELSASVKIEPRTKGANSWSVGFLHLDPIRAPRLER